MGIRGEGGYFVGGDLQLWVEHKKLKQTGLDNFQEREGNVEATNAIKRKHLKLVEYIFNVFLKGFFKQSQADNAFRL